MHDILFNLFGSGSFIPHGHCYLWKPSLVWLHLISDATIALAYYSIPLTLFYFVRKRQDLPFHGIFLLFAAFIILCGTTHIAEIWTLWHPTYWLSGLIKAGTAVVSLFTAIELVPLIPQALTLPSPTQLQQANKALQTQIDERLRAEGELRQLQDELEQRVQMRTAELVQVNQQLQQEIDERHRAEAAFRRSEAKFRRLVDADIIGVVSADTQGAITDANDAFVKMMGYTREEILTGKVQWDEITPPELRHLDAPAIEELLAYGAHTPFEKEYFHKDGHRVPILVGSALLEDDSNSVISFILDITERKRAEAESEQLLKREQIARAEAEAANRIKDEFLAVLSHELRTPLSPILGWAKLLQTGNLTPEKQAIALQTIERNAKLQTQLIEDLLDISRILQGKLTLDVNPVDLASAIVAAKETMRLAAEAKSIQIKTELESPTELIMGDANRLQQVMWNLLSNAVKFTPAGGQIDIRLEYDQAAAEITVKDTGKGISPDFLPYVFDYFRQADSSITRKFGGLGLGLAIVRQIVELHGGAVQAESQGEGQGATFTIRLPLREVVLPTVSTPSFSCHNSNLSGVNVLVVEDEADTRELVTVVLEQYGATVMAVASAEEALETFNQLTPDLLVSDIGMPGLDGYRFMRQIREMQQTQKRSIPAIALTAYVGEYNRQQALQAGFQHHLSKPVDPEALVKAISGLVNVRHSSASLSDRSY
jgi:PAS domain S-box-containing protein